MTAPNSDLEAILAEIEQMRSTLNAALDAMAQRVKGIISATEAAEPTPEPVPAMEAEVPEASPEWLRTLVMRCADCDCEPMVNLVAAASVLPGAAARQHAANQAGSAASSDPILLAALTDLLPALTMKYANTLEGISEEWGATLLEIQPAMLAWVQRWLGLELIVPLRGDWVNHREMQCIEWRNTAHTQEVDRIARVFSAGCRLRGSVAVPAKVAVYAVEKFG
jgi:hypothetical protein